MGAVTSTGLDLLTGGLRNINALEAGETPDANAAQDGLQVMNDLLDSLSTDKLFVYTSQENILAWTPGQYKYTIGNPVGGTLTGTFTSGSPTITGVTIPSTVINKGTIVDNAGCVPSGTTILSFNIGAGTITMSANSTFTPSTNPQTFTYTTPGDFGIARPLRIRPGFTRITSAGNSGLDYWWDVCSIDDYNELGYKGVPGPWPILLSYQTTYPLGTIFIYPNPSQAGEVHLWTDAILTQFTSLTQQISLPQGYSRAFKKLLALELAPEYGKTPSRELMRQADEARTLLKAMNDAPVKKLRYDTALTRASGKDASWIMSGGFT